MKSLIIIPFAVLVFGSATAKPAASDPNSERLSIKIVCLEKVPIIEVQLNGTTAYFVLDSGSDISILNSADADYYIFHVRNTASKDLKGFSGARRALYRVSHANLTVLDHILNAKFFATDLSHLVQTLENQTSIRINGIIGMDLMRAYGFEIDYRNKKLYLGPAS